MSIQQAKDLHHAAMSLYGQAMTVNAAGDTRQQDEYLLEAFEKEKQAALLVANDHAFEPSRSVLLRSAASIALQCGLFREAEKLCAIALCGNPHEEIADEIRVILDEIRRAQSLRRQGIELTEDEVELAIEGRAIGFGLAPADQVLRRIDRFERLVHRTAERKLGLSYRDRAGPHAEVRENFEVLLSAAHPGSYSIHMRIGRPSRQPMLPAVGGEVTVSNVLEDLIAGLEEINAGESEAVHRRIPQEAYYRNFVGLARELAPNGIAVNRVTLTHAGHGRKRAVSLDRTRSEIRPISLPEPTEEPITVQGVLKYADDTRGTNGLIKLIDENLKEYPILVPEGMLSDIVRPMWDQTVIVEGRRTGGTIRLDDIRPASEDSGK